MNLKRPHTLQNYPKENTVLKVRSCSLLLFILPAHVINFLTRRRNCETLSDSYSITQHWNSNFHMCNFFSRFGQNRSGSKCYGHSGRSTSASRKRSQHKHRRHQSPVQRVSSKQSTIYSDFLYNNFTEAHWGFFPPSCARSVTFIVVLFLNHFSSRYIVYDVAQINLKYLLKVRFNYQTSLWWSEPFMIPLQQK